MKLTELQQTIKKVLKTNKTVRVVSFKVGDKKYWLKQTEQPRGFMRLLKPNPKNALKHEVGVLQYLNKMAAPCAILVAYDEDYLVLKDIGKTVNQWMRDATVDELQKKAILNDCALALAELHQLDLVHGRPAIRDMGWHNGKVRFIDFESKLNIQRLQWNKIRDLLIFIHDLYRNNLSAEMIESAVSQYRQYDYPAGGEQVWQASVAFIYKCRFLYTLFKPFYPIAGKDLLASLKLFEYLLFEHSRKEPET